MLLTGTPLQNTVEELFSLLHFLEPLRFPAESTFMQEFGDLKTEEQVLHVEIVCSELQLKGKHLFWIVTVIAPQPPINSSHITFVISHILLSCNFFKLCRQ